MQEGDELYRGRRRTANPGDESTSFRQQALHVTWRALDTLDLNLFVPRVEIRNEANGRPDVDLEGPGDVSLALSWGPWRRAPGAGESGRLLDPGGVSFLAGLKFPTGEPSDSTAAGPTPPSLLQLGTGTYDPLFGVLYRGRFGSLTVFHGTAAQISGGESGAGLRPGNVLQTSTGIACAISDVVHPSLALEAVFRSKDVLNGDSIDNTGSTLWFVTPGVSIRVSDRLSLDASVRIPVYRNVHGTQIVPGNLWTFGLSLSF